MFIGVYPWSQEFVRLVCLLFGPAGILLLVPWLDFARKGAMAILGRLFLCFISAKGWELPIFPRGGDWILAVSCSPGGGGCYWRNWTEKMPKFFQRFRCDPVYRIVGFAASTCVGLLRRLQLERTVVGGERSAARRRHGWRRTWKTRKFAKKPFMSFFVILFSSKVMDVFRGCTVLLL